MDPSVTARRQRAVVSTVGLVVLAGCSSAVAMAFHASATDTVGIPFLAWLVGSALAVSLIWRHRFPVQLCLVASAAALVLPLDSVAALVCLTVVVANRPLRQVLVAGAAATLATAVALLRDATRPVEHMILSAPDATDELVPMPPAGFVAMGITVLVVAVGVGLLQRFVLRARVAEGQREVQAAAVADLRTEMTRREERELIAREVHDTVAHQLSLVALHASALRAASPDDVVEGAESIRAAAGQARRELRDLVDMLRDPAPGGPLHPAPVTLADLPGLLESTRQAGARLRSTVFVSDAAAAPATLTRAVYRIVQESLTNAHKHAPGTEITVDVHAAPGDGVRLRVSNGIPAADDGGSTPRHGSPDAVPVGRGSTARVLGADGRPAPSTSGVLGGAGLIGMRERAASLGGTLDAGQVDGHFVVAATLPWALGPEVGGR